jgi:hypothetical protein
VRYLSRRDSGAWAKILVPPFFDRFSPFLTVFPAGGMGRLCALSKTWPPTPFLAPLKNGENGENGKVAV